MRPWSMDFHASPAALSLPKDFTFTNSRNAAGSDSEIAQTPPVAIAVLASPLTFPGLNTQGLTHARVDIAIGDVIPLHTHPRSAETLFVLKGTIYTSFISDDYVLLTSTLKQGDVFLFPKGLQRFQLNVGKETAISFNTLISQSPGFLTTANQVFEPNITSFVVEISFGIDAAAVKKQLKASINPSSGTWSDSFMSLKFQNTV